MEDRPHRTGTLYWRAGVRQTKTSLWRFLFICRSWISCEYSVSLHRLHFPKRRMSATSRLAQRRSQKGGADGQVPLGRDAILSALASVVLGSELHFLVCWFSRTGSLR